jgi:hypothetical protein
MVDELNVSKDARFRLEMRPYQSSQDMSAQEKNASFIHGVEPT